MKATKDGKFLQLHGGCLISLRNAIDRVKRGKHTWQAGHGDTHSCKIYKLLRHAGAYKSLVWATAPNPLTQISSAATHRSDADLSTVLHERALSLCVNLVLRGHAVLHSSPYER